MDRSRISYKRSEHELKRIVEEAVTEVCRLEGTGLRFHVEAIEVSGRPPERIVVWSVLYFMASGSPYCCSETGCHLGLHCEAGEQVDDSVRLALGLEQDVHVDFGNRIHAEVCDGVQFTEVPSSKASSSDEPS